MIDNALWRKAKLLGEYRDQLGLLASMLFINADYFCFVEQFPFYCHTDLPEELLRWYS